MVFLSAVSLPSLASRGPPFHGESFNYPFSARSLYDSDEDEDDRGLVIQRDASSGRLRALSATSSSSLAAITSPAPFHGTSFNYPFGRSLYDDDDDDEGETSDDGALRLSASTVSLPALRTAPFHGESFNYHFGRSLYDDDDDSEDDNDDKNFAVVNLHASVSSISLPAKPAAASRFHGESFNYPFGKSFYDDSSDDSDSDWDEPELRSPLAQAATCGVTRKVSAFRLPAAVEVAQKANGAGEDVEADQGALWIGRGRNAT